MKKQRKTRADFAADMVALQRRRRAGGMCCCGRVPEPGRKSCRICLNRVSQWQKDNLIQVRQKKDRRKSRERRAAGFCTLAQWFARVEYFGWRCRYCKVMLTPGTLARDHAIPLSRGGSNWPSNLVPACGDCNASKGTRTLREFLGA